MSDTNHIYYSASIVQASTSDQNQERQQTPISYNITVQPPLLQNRSEYEMSIVRMSITNADIPYFIPLIKRGNDNPTQNVNLTEYSVAITWEPVSTGSPSLIPSTDVIWIPEIQNPTTAPAPSPLSTIQGQDFSSSYYWCSSPYHWIDMINNTLATASGIASGYIAGGITYPTLSNPPQLSWDGTTNLFTMNFPDDGFVSSKSASDSNNYIARVYFNTNLWNMFKSFPNTYFNTTNLPDGYTVRLNIPLSQIGMRQDFYPSTSSSTYPAYDLWRVSQQYASIGLWSPVQSVSIKTTMPIRTESGNAPVLLGESNSSANTTSLEFESQLTDVALDLNNDSINYQGTIYYAPTAEYRMISLRGTNQLNEINLTIFWRLKYTGQLYPLYLLNGGNFEAKFMFRRKF